MAVEITPIESSNSMGIGERYHAPLRRIFLKIQHDSPGTDKELILAIANKAMNDTAGPEGLVPTFLVFGVIPRIPTLSHELPEQNERLKMMSKARLEMEPISAKLRSRTVPKKRASNAAHAILKEGDPVLVWRKYKALPKWTGPFLVLKIEGKTVTIAGDNGNPKEFNAYAVKLYITDDDNCSLKNRLKMAMSMLPDNNGNDSEDVQDIPELVSNSESEWSGAEDDDEEGQGDDWSDPDYVFDPADEEFYSGYDSAGDQYIYLTEVLPIEDARGKEPRFDAARKLEVDGLESMGTWKRFDLRNVGKDANVLGSRFALATKNVGSADEKEKARLIVQGHTDREKFNVVHNSTTLHQRSMRIILSIAAMHQFQVWSHDITQAYPQSDSPLLRGVYILPPSELNMPEHTALKLVKPLYGLADSGDYWGSTSSRHHKIDLGLTSTWGLKFVLQAP